MYVRKVQNPTLVFKPKYAVLNAAGEVVALTRTVGGAYHATTGINNALGDDNWHTYTEIEEVED